MRGLNPEPDGIAGYGDPGFYLSPNLTMFLCHWGKIAAWRAAYTDVNVSHAALSVQVAGALQPLGPRRRVHRERRRASAHFDLRSPPRPWRVPLAFIPDQQIATASSAVRLSNSL